MADVVIIGAGPAGMSAAIYARRAGMSTVIYEGNMYGGQIVNTPEVENYPAIQKISGFDFAQNLYEQVTSLGAEMRMEPVVAIEGSASEGFTVRSEFGSEPAKAVIIATGAKNRNIGLEDEERLTGRGVSYCATCDGAFFKGKTVAVFGGGNTAVEDALYLANLAGKVYLIHRRNQFRAEAALADQARANSNIEILTPCIVTGLKGADKLTAIEITDVADGKMRMLDVDALFIAIGQIPAAAPFANVVELSDGYVVAGEDCKTSAEGIFVAGDGRTKTVRQLTTAAADGATAALAACDFIRSLG
ncbi:MAG: FAD-dependent oxidoreductase [Clostridiales bacterium]|nr:FAD-dependent oxidoreductase [Clostridiales bacterium]